MGQDDEAAAVPASTGDDKVVRLMRDYLDMIALIERLHRLLLDVIKDEFERIGMIEINVIQALLLFNIGDKEVTVGELKSRGYYHGSNASYNLKKLVDLGYLQHKRSEVDRRTVRIKLTEKGNNIHDIVARLFATHANKLTEESVMSHQGIQALTTNLRQIRQFWTGLIRYLY